MFDRGTVRSIDREVLRQEVKISQGRARYEVAGEGYPVVLVHDGDVEQLTDHTALWLDLVSDFGSAVGYFTAADQADPR